MKKSLISLLSLGLLSLNTPALADEHGNDLLSLGIGYYDILDDDGAVDFRVEYRPDYELLWDIKPWAGAEVTSDFSAWAGGGLLLNYEFMPSWYVTPSVGVGLYAQGSSDLDLSNTLQFRSQLEVAYEYDSGHRAGLAFGHISNASLDDDNPGTEILNLYWHLPY